MHRTLMKRYLIAASSCLLLLCAGSGARAKGHARQMPDLSERFALTTKPQRAVFFVGSHWTGGMGSMPVLDLKTERPKRMEELPIFFDASRKGEVDAKLPGCVRGTPLVKVSADIRLVKKTGTNWSIREAPTQSFYEAVASSISKIDVWAEPCEE